MNSASHHTRWHKCVDQLIAQSTRKEPLFEENRLILQQAAWFDLNESLPVFVITQEPTGGFIEGFTITSGDEWDQYNLLLHSGSVFLPFDRFIIESDISGDRWFMVVNRSAQGKIGICILCCSSVGPLCIAATNEPCGYNMNATWLFNEVVTIKMMNERGLTKEKVFECLVAYTQVFRKLCVQLATKGMVQERTEAPAALNKQRVRKGKTPVPTVIHMRPGHYYDRDGNQHAVDARNPVRMHWRRGHTRGTWCGTGDSRRLEQRYIAPCLVNYDGGEQPEHKVRILH